jgi:predicted dehydrogenase
MRDSKFSGAKALRVAVIGTGEISDEHLRFLAASPRARLEAVCDLSPALARLSARQYGAARAATDYRAMLEEARPDVVHVLTPPHSHATVVRHCLEAGCHVIVEKPIAPTHAEFQDLWTLARGKERWLIEDHNYRFNKPVQRMEQWVRTGRLGEIQEVDVRMALPIREASSRYADENLPHPSHRMPGGVVHEFITHLCYLALRFLPDRSIGDGVGFDRAHALWGNTAGGGLFKYDELDALVIRGGVHARLRLSCQTRPAVLQIVIRGTQGEAATDLYQPYLVLNAPRFGGGQLTPLINQWLSGWHLVFRSLRNFFDKLQRISPYEGLATFLDLTYASLATGGTPPVTFDDMDTTSRLIDLLVAQAGS